MIDSEREKALQCWPGGWPGRQVVDLDDVGDPDIWLEERIDNLEEALGGNVEAVSEAAAFLAEDYLATAAEMSFPVPSDFDCSEEEELQMVTADFCGFLREWHRRIVSTKGGVE